VLVAHLRVWIVVLPMLATGVLIELRPPVPPPPREPLALLPNQLGSWIGSDVPLDEDTLKILGHGEFLQRDYENTSNPQPGINLFVAYYPSQRAGDTLHPPEHCIFGAGFRPVSHKIVWTPSADGSPVPVNRYVVEKGLDRRLVIFWYQAHGRTLTSIFVAKYYLIRDSIRMNRSDGAMVRWMTPMPDSESADAAQARLMKLGSRFFLSLDRAIPR